jgi:hypothetical protein
MGGLGSMQKTLRAGMVEVGTIGPDPLVKQVLDIAEEHRGGDLHVPSHGGASGDPDEIGINTGGATNIMAGAQPRVIIQQDVEPPGILTHHSIQPTLIYDHESGRTFSNAPPIVSSTHNLHARDRDYTGYMLKTPNVLDPLGGVGRLRFERGEITTWSNFFDVKNRDLQYQQHIPGLASSAPDVLTQQRVPFSVGEQVSGITPWVNHKTQHSFPLSTSRLISGRNKLRHMFIHFCLVLNSLNSLLPPYQEIFPWK